MPFTPRVIDVPIVGLDESAPEHGGPEGRATVLKNAQVTHYTPAEPGVPTKLRIEPREAFVSMPAAMRDGSTGAADATTTWANPELLEALSDQLVEIADGVPRVFNGTGWTSYPGSRVVPGKLSQDVLHTTNHLLQAPDCARIGTVTCSTWVETVPNPGGTQYNPMVAFRADDGTWVRTPFAVWTNPPGSPTTMIRVVSDGTRFWVFSTIGVISKIGVWVYDTTGTQLASDTTRVPLTWAVSPGYWDVAPGPDVASPFAMLLQPAANTTTGADVGATVWKFTYSAGSITVASGSLAGSNTAKCSGPVAFLQNGANITNMYAGTVGAAGALFAYETNLSGVVTKEYVFGAVVAGSTVPDSLTGWAAVEGGTVTAHVAYSLLSNFSPPSGPLNDPGLRYTRSYACTRAGAVSLANQVNGVLLSSRAFKVDSDWYAAVYYQGGQGLTKGGATSMPFIDDATDYLLGDAVQPLKVQWTDIIIGSPFKVVATGTENFLTANANTKLIIVPSQATGAIAHNAGDSAVAATATWTLLNAAFANVATVGGNSAFNSLLRISGSAVPGNNGDWRVVQVVSATVVITEAVSTTGNAMANDTLAGATAQLISTTTVAYTTEVNGGIVPAGSERFYTGSVVTSGFRNAANNTTFTAFQVATNAVFPNWPGPLQPMTMFLCTPVGTNIYESPLPDKGPYIIVTPTKANTWGLFAELFTTQDNGQTLHVEGTPQNDGDFEITSLGGLTTSPQPVTGNETSLIPQSIGPPLPRISLVLSDPNQAYRLHIAAAAFDPSWLNAYVTISGLDHSTTDGVYQVTEVLSTTDLKLIPVDGKTGQRNDMSLHGASISVTRVTDRQSSIQPCWYLMPLSIAQRAAGRWDWGQAWADWRYDGETKANVGTFERNAFPLALSSVVASADGRQFVLPYRAQSFTAGQVVTNTQGQTGLAISAQSTVGLKLFDLSASPGLAVPADSEMLLPGPQASQFSADGFPEDGINLGPEKPWLVSQATVASALALTRNVTVQYAVAFEIMTESGDRVWSTISPTLDVTLRGTQNKNTIAGRMPGPTNRVVGVAIYRTANLNGVPTIQHYKITNDLDVNGTGFTFTSVSGAGIDTWQFADTVPDAAILSAEVIYTDKALLQRFPAPAFSQGVSGWKARDWVVAYDGAVWMSGERVEGDATWWHPAFRYTAFGDDRPNSVCPLDDYLLVFCDRSIWYIPSATFPDATGRNGTLPTPVQLPFTNGGTGFAKAIRAGAVYSSTAGGAWLITRDLQNVWLSEPVRDSLTTIAGLAIDGKQRLWVTTGTASIFIYDQVTKGWWQWTVPQAALCGAIAVHGGQAAFTSRNNVAAIKYTPGAYLDRIDGAQDGIAPDLTFASLEFGGVRSFKCMWACQLIGTYLGPHRLNVIMSYPDDEQAATVFPPFTPDPARPYIYEVNPMVEETASYSLRIYADFVGVPTPGASFSLEVLSFEIGLEPGIARQPAARRIPGA